MTAQDFEQLTGMDVLEELDVLGRIEHEIAVDRLLTVARFLCEHRAETVDAVRSRLPGRQRAVRLGGAGTPRVAEFAPALAAGRLGLSAWSGARLCADVLDLEFRLPLLWASLGRYEAKAGLARHVARRTRELSLEQAGLVDARVVGSADGRLAWGRFTNLVDAAVIEADVEAARRREEEARLEQFAKASRSSEHGMRGFYVRAPFPVIVRIDATVAFLADALAAQGHPGSLDERRVLAVLLMANPAQALALMRMYRQQASSKATKESPKSSSDGTDAAGGGVEPSETLAALAPQEPAGLRPSSTSESVGPASDDVPEPEEPPEPDEPRDVAEPQALAGTRDRVRFSDVLDQARLLPHVQLYVHLSETPTGVARVEGESPISAGWVRRWFGSHCSFTIKPVLVPAAQRPVDAWEVPTRHREAVHVMSPADVFPWAANTTRHVQIDHTVAYDPTGPPGQSGIGNYGPTDRLPPPAQDPRRVAGRPTLPRHLPLARPLRCDLPRRPHRKQTTHGSRRSLSRSRSRAPQARARARAAIPTARTTQVRPTRG